MSQDTTKIVVIEVEVDANDKTIVGEIASDLSHYNLISVGFKRPAIQTPVYRGDGSLLDKTRSAIG